MWKRVAEAVVEVAQEERLLLQRTAALGMGLTAITVGVHREFGVLVLLGGFLIGLFCVLLDE